MLISVRSCLTTCVNGHALSSSARQNHGVSATTPCILNQKNWVIIMTRSPTMPICPVHGVRMVKSLLVGDSLVHCPIVEDAFRDLRCEYVASRSKFDGCWYVTNSEERDIRRRTHAAIHELCYHKRLLKYHDLRLRIAALLQVPIQRAYIQYFGIHECKKVIAYLVRLTLELEKEQ